MLRFLILFLTLALTACAPPELELGFSKKEWQTLSPQKRKELLQNFSQIRKQTDVPNTIYKGPSLKIVFLKGFAKMPPYFDRQAFETKAFSIAAGECRWLPLTSENKKYSTVLQVCYDGLHLVIDPSHYDLDRHKGALQFDYNPIWKQGFTYTHLKSEGYVGLSEVSLLIKTLP